MQVASSLVVPESVTEATGKVNVLLGARGEVGVKSGAVISLNVAVKKGSIPAFTGMLHEGAVPEQALDHPMKVEPEFAAAFRVMVAPCGNDCLQGEVAVSQDMLPDTPPEPVPLIVTVSEYRVETATAVGAEAVPPCPVQDSV